MDGRVCQAEGPETASERVENVLPQEVDLPTEAVVIVDRCLQRQMVRRYLNADELLHALGEDS